MAITDFNLQITRSLKTFLAAVRTLAFNRRHQKLTFVVLAYLVAIFGINIAFPKEINVFYIIPRLQSIEGEQQRYVYQKGGKYRSPCYYCNTTATATSISVGDIDQKCLSQNRHNLDRVEIQRHLRPFCNKGRIPSCDMRQLLDFNNGYWVCCDNEMLIRDKGYGSCPAFPRFVPVYCRCHAKCKEGYHLMEHKIVRCNEARYWSPPNWRPRCKKVNTAQFRKNLKGRGFDMIKFTFRKEAIDDMKWKLEMNLLYISAVKDKLLAIKESLRQEQDQIIRTEIDITSEHLRTAIHNLNIMYTDLYNMKPLQTLMRSLEVVQFSIESVENAIWTTHTDIENIEAIVRKLELVKHGIESAEEILSNIRLPAKPKFITGQKESSHVEGVRYQDVVLLIVLLSPCTLSLFFIIRVVYFRLSGPHGWYYLGDYEEDSFSVEIMDPYNRPPFIPYYYSFPSGTDLEEIYNIQPPPDCLLILGGNGKMLTTSQIKTEISTRKNVAICFLIHLEEKDNDVKLTYMSRLALWLPIECQRYWSVVPLKGDHLGWTENHVYKTLKQMGYIKGRIQKFEAYNAALNWCTEIYVHLKRCHTKLVVYPGKMSKTQNNILAICTFDTDRSANYSERILTLMKKNNVNPENLINRTIELGRINAYLNNAKAKPVGKYLWEVLKDVEDTLMTKHSNLNAISCSSVKSRREGLEIEDCECIVLYCTCKGIVPLLEKEFPRQIQGIPVDVREGYALPCCCTDFCDPLLFGVSVGASERNTSGSIGPFVSESHSGRNGFLSCAHVFLEIPISSNGYYTYLPERNLQIVQPSDPDEMGCNLDRRCGVLKSAFLGNVTYNEVEIGTDVSYVELTSRNPESPGFPPVCLSQMRDNGYIKNPVVGGVLWEPDEDDIEHVVYKCGRSTGFTRGTISTEFCGMKRTSQEGNLPGSRIRFIYLKHLYEIRGIGGEKFFKLGDSGAAVFIKKKNKMFLLGIAIGEGNAVGDICYVSPIAAATKALADDPRQNIDINIRTFDQECMELD